MKVPYVDLKKQHTLISKRAAKALSALARRGDFILGKEVGLFEAEFAAYCGSRYAVGVNSGTDALFLSLKALGIGPGDEVIVPAFTFIATANAVSYCGAKPVFCDIDPDTYCLDADCARRRLTRRTKAIIPVHLYGQCCDMDAVRKLAAETGLKVVEDACQAHGALYRGKKAGAMGDAGCFSFYPTKNLGGWGDGGMVVTSNEALFKKLLMLRDCGRKSKYEHAMVGYNSRLDTLQAAVLREELKLLERWNARRQRNAVLYARCLAGIKEVTLPSTPPGSSHVYHIYALRARERNRLLEFLKKQGIGVMVHYPVPLHLQPAYAELNHRKGDFPVSERTCAEIITLPMHPFLSRAQIGYVCANIREFYRQ